MRPVVLNGKHLREGKARFRTRTTAPTIAGPEVVGLSNARVVPLLQALEATDLVPEMGRLSAPLPRGAAPRRWTHW